MPAADPPSANASVCAIVLNWNNPDDTIRCLRSLLPAVAGHDVTLVCCDNASGDASVALIDDWARATLTGRAPPVPFYLIRTAANLGYAGGNNAALRFAFGLGEFAYFWLLNNDTEVETGALTALLCCARAGGATLGALGSTIVDADRPRTVQCAAGFRYRPALTWTRRQLAGWRLEDARSRAAEPRLDGLCGASMFLGAHALRRAGLLNPGYFLYYEELDHARRLRRAGFTLGWCRASVVRHRGGASTGSRRSARARGSALAEFHENLSTLKFTAWNYPLLLPAACASRLAMKLAGALLFRRWASLGALLKAFAAFVTPRPRPPAPGPVGVLTAIGPRDGPARAREAVRSPVPAREAGSC